MLDHALRASPASKSTAAVLPAGATRRPFQLPSTKKPIDEGHQWRLAGRAARTAVFCYQPPRRGASPKAGGRRRPCPNQPMPPARWRHPWRQGTIPIKRDSRVNGKIRDSWFGVRSLFYRNNLALVVFDCLVRLILASQPKRAYCPARVTRRASRTGSRNCSNGWSIRRPSLRPTAKRPIGFGMKHTSSKIL